MLGILPLLLNFSMAATLKVAVFDNGFQGADSAIGKTLPAATQVIRGKVEQKNPSPHGTKMAEVLVAQLKIISPNSQVELFLYEVNGFTNFKDAITSVIANKIPLVLHAIVRDYGSNGDGGGIFNAEVNRATGAGIIWINAAGNFAKTVKNAPIQEADNQGWVLLDGVLNVLRVSCKPPYGRTSCPLRLALSWTDTYSDDGTEKDLDLFLWKMGTQNPIASSELRQVKGPRKSEKESNYPRELIQMEVPPGVYYSGVRRIRGPFGAKDQLRIATDADFVELDYNDGNESLMSPADNPNVITVGASDSDRSSRSFKMQKPEIELKSRIQMGTNIAMGSSIASARAAGIAAAVLAENPKSNRLQVLKVLSEFTGR